MPTPPSQPPGPGRAGTTAERRARPPRPAPEPGARQPQPAPEPGARPAGPAPEPGARQPRPAPELETGRPTTTSEPGVRQPQPETQPTTRKPTRPGCQREAGRPLPDPAAVRLCAVPDSAPPYDDEALAGTRSAGTGPTASAARTGHTARVDGSGGATRDGQESDSRGLRPPIPDPGRLDSAHSDPAHSDSAHSDPADPTSTRPSSTRPHPARPKSPRPEPGRPDSADPGGDDPDRGVAPGWPSLFAQVLAETLAGARPAGQIVPWTTQRARSSIQRLGPTLADGQPTARQRPLVRRVVTSQPRSDVLEMTVIVGFGPRIRALAVRLELSQPRGIPAGRAARWLCTAVEAA